MLRQRGRSYITTPIKDTKLSNFLGRIEQYEILQGAGSFDMFMRHCVANRCLHETPQAGPSTIQADEGDESPEYNVLRVAGYEVSETSDDIVVHPVDEIAMDDETVPCFPETEVCKVIFLTNFLGPTAELPILFLWRPESKRIRLYLPHLPSAPSDANEEQEELPMIAWDKVLMELKESRRIAYWPERVWRSRMDAEEFEYFFMLLVKFFRRERMDEKEQAEE